MSRLRSSAALEASMLSRIEEAVLSFQEQTPRDDSLSWFYALLTEPSPSHLITL